MPVSERMRDLIARRGPEAREKYIKAGGQIPRRLPVQAIPGDYSPETEQRRMKHGGCCGGASKGE
jgi:hypothetical protein